MPKFLLKVQLTFGKAFRILHFQYIDNQMTDEVDFCFPHMNPLLLQGIEVILYCRLAQNPLRYYPLLNLTMLLFGL